MSWEVITSLCLRVSVCLLSFSPAFIHSVSGIVHDEDTQHHLPPCLLGPTMWTFFLERSAAWPVTKVLGEASQILSGPWRNNFQGDSQLSISNIKGRHHEINTYEGKLWHQGEMCVPSFSPSRDPQTDMAFAVGLGRWYNEEYVPLLAQSSPE